jgi:methyl-accepting chemotaxis protein
MADPADLLSAWQDAIREVGAMAASLVSGSAGIAQDVLAPLQRQTELLERVLQRQVEFEREMLSRAVAPARAVLDFADQATATLRAQAMAYQTVSSSLGQLADVLEQQARIMETATKAIRDPVAALKSALPEDSGAA